MSDPSRRMLALLSVLQTGQAWTGPELARRLDTPPRTLRRDIDRLRELGYPVQTQTGPGGYYRLVAGAAMPPLLLNDDEAVAVALSLRLAARTSPVGEPDESGELGEPGDDAASGALRKLEQILPARLRRKVAAVRDVTEKIPGPAVAEVPVALFSVVGEAAQRRQRLRFTYRDRDGAGTTRDVEPYRQVFSRHRWYLLAWDVARGDWRTFRFDRMAGVVVTEQYFAPRELPAETAAAYLQSAWREPRHRAVITFAAPIDQVSDRFLARDGVLEPLDGGHCRYTAWVDSYEWLAASVTILGVDFVVGEPAGFVEYCRTLRDRLGRAVEEDR